MNNTVNNKKYNQKLQSMQNYLVLRSAGNRKHLPKHKSPV